MPTFRRERMGEAIRKVVTQKLLRDHSLFPQAVVTISKVDVSQDFGHAKIFYSVFGQDVDESDSLAVMKDMQNEFRFEISQKLNLRKTPKVEFCFDKNPSYANKIDQILKGD